MGSLLEISMCTKFASMLFHSTASLSFSNQFHRTTRQDALTMRYLLLFDAGGMRTFFEDHSPAFEVEGAWDKCITADSAIYNGLGMSQKHVYVCNYISVREKEQACHISLRM